MKIIKRASQLASLAALTVWVLTGCGGSNDVLPAKTSISKIYVAGDSLADVGTFNGLKFTVVDAVTPSNSLLWPQLIANQFGLDGSAQCNFFTINASTGSTSTNNNCTNYAIADARIVNKSTDTVPTVGTQLTTRGLAPYAADDLLLVDGGGNDASDLISASSDATQFQTILLQQLSAPQLTTLMTQDATGNAAAVAYMEALASNLYNSIKTQALDKGATRIAVLNIPDVTITPKLKTIQGTPYQTTFRAWITAYNTKLKTLVSGDSRIALVDFYADFQDEIANPTSYNLSNVTDAACTVFKGSPFSYMPCTAAELDATAGKTAGWWKRYLFSDQFHPSPYGHQLLSISVSRALARAGWL
jgi:outer membrane lipase/esterase